MFRIHFNVTANLPSKRGHAKLMREINQAVMERIRDVYWPQHYTNNPKTRPGGEYGYEPRGRRYMIYKAKKYGHQKPLVFTGGTRDAVLGSAKITATQHKSKLIGKTAFPRPRKLAKEMEAVAKTEVDSLLKWSTDTYIRQLRTGNYGRSYKIKTKG